MSDDKKLNDLSTETANLSLGTEKSPDEGEGKDENEPFAAPQSTETATGNPEDAVSSTMAEPGAGVVNSEDDLKESCRDMFSKIAKYMEGELSASVDNYTLLETLNNLTTAKYSDMSNMAKTLITSMEELDGKYKSLQPYLDQIDKLEESVASLEQAAYRLDSYSKKLEAKFKKLEKR